MVMAQHTGMLAEGGIELVQGLTLFMLAGFLMGFGALLFGRLIRPSLPHPEKGAAYECGEPAIGSSWVQFDVRFYVVALVFLVFDVEIALFYPWAVVYGAAGPEVRLIALYDMLFFFGVIGVGFVYLWRFGYLDWVRAYSGRGPDRRVAPPPAPRERELEREMAQV
jgi:NADH-quinone oxidoreductase subunit A